MSFSKLYVSKRFAQHLMLAIETDCLTHRDYIPWADALIETAERPPPWICEFATSEGKAEALAALREFPYGDQPALDASDDVLPLDFLGFLWVRYEQRRLSWANFLDAAGQYTDGTSRGLECEYFYYLLNELEEKNFAPDVENRQRLIVQTRLGASILNAKQFCEAFPRKG